MSSIFNLGDNVLRFYEWLGEGVGYKRMFSFESSGNIEIEDFKKPNMALNKFGRISKIDLPIQHSEMLLRAKEVCILVESNALELGNNGYEHIKNVFIFPSVFIRQFSYFYSAMEFEYFSCDLKPRVSEYYSNSSPADFFDSEYTLLEGKFYKGSAFADTMFLNIVEEGREYQGLSLFLLMDGVTQGDEFIP